MRLLRSGLVGATKFTLTIPFLNLFTEAGFLVKPASTSVILLSELDFSVVVHSAADQPGVESAWDNQVPLGET